MKTAGTPHIFAIPRGPQLKRRGPGGARGGSEKTSGFASVFERGPTPLLEVQPSARVSPKAIRVCRRDDLKGDEQVSAPDT